MKEEIKITIKGETLTFEGTTNIIVAGQIIAFLASENRKNVLNQLPQ